VRRLALPLRAFESLTHLIERGSINLTTCITLAQDLHS
jgi:hypothetical protein